MAVPKKKVSPGRKKTRRQFYELNAVASITCPHCLETKRPHCICDCGYYDGRQVLAKPQKNAQHTH